MPNLECFECHQRVEGADLEELGDSLLSHARSEHDWPYPDQGIRNYAHATQRLTGDSERLDKIGDVEIHPVTEDRIDDWLSFFDHDAFVGTPEWAACYCLEPHVGHPEDESSVPHWRENRAAMMELLRSGSAFGYLAYVDGRPAGWVNASRRDEYQLYAGVDPDGPEPHDVVGVSCFIVAPPYRRHGLAEALLDRVLDDARGRGVSWVEGYPFSQSKETDAGNFRGPESLYLGRGFEPVETRERDTVMRRRVGSAP